MSASEPVPPATPARAADWEAFYRDYRKPGYVSGFEITTKLGGGMFGLVFRARKQSIGKDYAIKFLQVDDVEVRRAVLAELEAVKLFAQVDHPNLVSIEDRGEVDGIPFLVMSFAGTETLKDRIPPDGRVPTPGEHDELLRYFLQACRGVAALHERSLVHFDIKPANIFIKGAVARVGDYGLSKLVTHSRGSLSMGRGTPYYMAPEMLQRRGDHRSDIYSLGIVLYELLCGSVPFRGDSEWEVLRKHEKEAPTLPAHLSARERSVLQRCLQKEPGARFQSVHELIAALGAPASAAAAALGDAALGDAALGGGAAANSAGAPPPGAKSVEPPRADEEGDPYAGFRKASKEAIGHAHKIAKAATASAFDTVQKAAKQARELVEEQVRRSREGQPTWFSEFRQRRVERSAARAAARAERRARRRPIVRTLVAIFVCSLVASVFLTTVRPSPDGIEVAAVASAPSLYSKFEIPLAYQGLVSTSEPDWVAVAEHDPAGAKQQLEAHLSRVRAIAPWSPDQRAASRSIPLMEGMQIHQIDIEPARIGQALQQLAEKSQFDPQLFAELERYAPESMAMAAEELAKIRWKNRSDVERARRLQEFLVQSTGCSDLVLVDDDSLSMSKVARGNRNLGQLWSWYINEIAQSPRTWQTFQQLRGR